MAALKGSNKTIWIAGLGTILTTFQLVIIGNYIVIFLKEDLLTAIILITLIISLRNALQLFLRVPFGDLSQIIGRKPLILGGHFSFTISLFLMSIATNWIWVLIAIVFVAIGMSAFWPCMLAYISDISSNNNSGGSIGRMFQLSDIGSIVGLLISSLILDEYQLTLTDLFSIAAILAFFFGLINIIILPESLDKIHRKQIVSIPKAIMTSFSSMLSTLKQMTLTKDLTLAYIFQLIVAFTEFTATTFLPLLIVQKGFSRGDVSEIGLWATLVTLWFKPFLGKLTDRFHFIYVITSTVMIYSLALFAFTIINDYLLLIILFVIMNASLITAYMAENNEVARRAPFALRGTALGSLGFYVALGRTSSTVISGPIWEIFGLTGVFNIIILGVLVIILILFFMNRPKREPLRMKSKSVSYVIQD
ncbi:MAG: MFS transporter [Promethearchaeota archaeon]